MFTYVKMAAVALMMVVGSFFIGKVSITTTDKSMSYGLILFSLGASCAFLGWAFVTYKLRRIEHFCNLFLPSAIVQGRVDKELGVHAKRLQKRFADEDIANAAFKASPDDDDLHDAAVGATAQAQSAKKRYWSLYGLVSFAKSIFDLDLRPSFKDYLG